MDGKQYFLEYENIHFICFNCGCYGHSTDKFPLNNSNQIVENVQTELETQQEKPKYGEWMIVKKNRRPRKKPSKEKKSKDSPNLGQEEAKKKKQKETDVSRYLALAGIDPEDDTEESDEEMEKDVSPKANSVGHGSSRQSPNGDTCMNGTTEDDIGANNVSVEGFAHKEDGGPLANRYGPGREVPRPSRGVGGRGMAFGGGRPPDSQTQNASMDPDMSMVPYSLEANVNYDEEMEDAAKHS